MGIGEGDSGDLGLASSEGDDDGVDDDADDEEEEESVVDSVAGVVGLEGGRADVDKASDDGNVDDGGDDDEVAGEASSGDEAMTAGDSIFSMMKL